MQLAKFNLVRSKHQVKFKHLARSRVLAKLNRQASFRAPGRSRHQAHDSPQAKLSAQVSFRRLVQFRLQPKRRGLASFNQECRLLPRFRHRESHCHQTHHKQASSSVLVSPKLLELYQQLKLRVPQENRALVKRRDLLKNLVQLVSHALLKHLSPASLPDRVKLHGQLSQSVLEKLRHRESLSYLV